ncbi:MAG: TetR/AcrR family transcriptional regulator [Spirochaetota bacterium]
MPKVVDHEKYREEILKRAFELFARKGYDSLTMREIAKELDISTGTLYHYFSNKSSIFRQMIELLNRDRILQILDNLDSAVNPHDKIQSMILNVLQAEKFFQDLIFLLFDYFRRNDLTDPEGFIPPILQYYRKSIMENLGITKEKIADVLISFLIGLIIQRMMNPYLDTESHIKTLLLFLEDAAENFKENENYDTFMQLKALVKTFPS